MELEEAEGELRRSSVPRVSAHHMLLTQTLTSAFEEQVGNANPEELKSLQNAAFLHCLRTLIRDAC